MKKAWAYIWKHSAENLILFNSIYTVLFIALISFNPYVPEELKVDEFIPHWTIYTTMTLTFLTVAFGIIQFLFGAYEFKRWLTDKASFYDGFLAGLYWGWTCVSLFLPIAPSLLIIRHADLSEKNRWIWNPIKKIQTFLNKPIAPAILYNVLLWTSIITYAVLSILFGIVDDSNASDTKPSWLNMIMTLSFMFALLMFFIQCHLYMIISSSEVKANSNAWMYSFIKTILVLFVPYYWTLLLIWQR